MYIPLVAAERLLGALLWAVVRRVWPGGGLGSLDLAKGVEDCIGCYKVFII